MQVRDTGCWGGTSARRNSKLNLAYTGRWSENLFVKPTNSFVVLVKFVYNCTLLLLRYRIVSKGFGQSMQEFSPLTKYRTYHFPRHTSYEIRLAYKKLCAL